MEQVIVQAYLDEGDRAGYLFQDNQLYQLEDLLTDPTGWDILSVDDINASGQMVGTATYNGNYYAYLITPRSGTGNAGPAGTGRIDLTKTTPVLTVSPQTQVAGDPGDFFNASGRILYGYLHKMSIYPLTSCHLFHYNKIHISQVTKRRVLRGGMRRLSTGVWSMGTFLLNIAMFNILPINLTRLIYPVLNRSIRSHWANERSIILQ